jgi:hypothetical protein
MTIASEPDAEPVGLFFVGVSSGLVAVGGIVGEDLEESVFSAWRSFSAELAEKGRPTPAKVRTEDEASAAALRRVVGEEVEVTSGPTPEAAELEASLRGRGVPASYFHGQSLDTALSRTIWIRRTASTRSARRGRRSRSSRASARPPTWRAGARSERSKARESGPPSDPCIVSRFG